MSEKTNLHNFRCLTAAHLKLIAMVCMLIDHTWGILVSGQNWMNCVGRLAFPIFAFQVAEGYAHTKNFKKYLLRLLVFALVSEIPYNFMTGGWWINPLGQNVMFTFLLALLLIRVIDRARARHWALGLLAVAVGGILGYFVGTFTFVDYYGSGILMVLVFWLFREVKFGWLIQLAAMIYVNVEMLGGLGFEVGGHFIPNQAFAVLAMIPILLYNGQQGRGGRAFRWVCYAFYPVHVLILVLIALL